MRKTVCLFCVVILQITFMFFCFAEDTIAVPYCGELGSDNLEDEEAWEISSNEFIDEEASEGSALMYIIGQPYVRLRQTDSTTMPYLDKMPYGSEVTVIASQINDTGEEWSLVIYNGRYGYCMTQYLADEIEAPASSMHPRTMEEAFGTSVLQRGNSNPNYRVKNLQLCLIAGGFLNDENGADGYFGKNTFIALCKFQKSQGMQQAGRAGNTTKTRLWYVYATFLVENGVMQ